jgi:cytochrome P450
MRGLVHRAFTPRLIQELRPRIQQIADDLIDAMQQRGDGQIELIDEFAFPLPVIVIAELLGLPPADRDQFRAWTTALTQIIPADDPRTAMVAETALEFTAYLADLFDQRRAAPRDDLISGLVQARDQGDTLSEVELHSTVLLLLVAGHETTVNLLGNSVLTLLQHPQQLAQLRAEPDHMEAAVEELLRFCGPVHSTMRFAREPVVYGGHTIARGEGVLLLLPTANRDPQRHTDSDTFDITRVDRRHLSFGQGIHFCLGAPLARLEAQIALTTLFRRFPDLALGDGVEQGVDDITFGVRRLPLRYSEARGAS